VSNVIYNMLHCVATFVSTLFTNNGDSYFNRDHQNAINLKLLL